MSTYLATETSPVATRSVGWIDRFARRLFCGKLGQLSAGRITLRDANSTQRFGASIDGDLHCTVHVDDARFYRHAVLGGSLSVAESFIRGQWTCDDLTALFRIFIRNTPVADQLDRGLSRLMKLLAASYHRLHTNSKHGSRRNIHAHYDLGNEFFSLFLDDTLCYSSGIFTSDESTLRDASVEKMDRICRKLDLQPDDHLLEIGTGWGGFAIHAAQQYGCRVTTTTISREQFELARVRVREAGLEHRVAVLLSDYRDLVGQFDKMVSIEMIEAVGHAYFDTYFRQCGRLLRPGGSFVMQGIVMNEQRYAQYLRSVDFIQHYIFPGGCLPSVAALAQSVGRTSELRVTHLEDFGPHYAETLRHWRRRFHQRLDEVRQLGYSADFIRMWEYYLCYCEAAFEERCIGVVQMQFDHPECRRDVLSAVRHVAAPARKTLEFAS